MTLLHRFLRACHAARSAFSASWRGSAQEPLLVQGNVIIGNNRTDGIHVRGHAYTPPKNPSTWRFCIQQGARIVYEGNDVAEFRAEWAQWKTQPGTVSWNGRVRTFGSR